MSSTSSARDHGIVRRMASLPRSILGGFSRAMSDIGLAGSGGRRRVRIQHPPSDSPFHHPSQPSPEEWAFLDSFESQYGDVHPFFYACRFREVLKLAEQDQKFVFVYLHSPEHPFTRVFCNETLRSDVVIQFLDVNFVCWAGLADRGEGLQMVNTLRPASFPFCALVAPSSGDAIAVLQQIEGPISAGELVEILQRTVEEQGLAFGSAKAKQQERIRADRRLREEQDAAFLAALQIDKEKEKLRNSPSGGRVENQKPIEASNARNYEKLRNNSDSKHNTRMTEPSTTDKGVPKRGGQSSQSQPTQILIRFPNGERREQSFSSTDKIQSIFSYIDSLGVPGIANYRLVSNFPRRVYGVDQMRMTLKDAGLFPKASLFLEPMPI